MKPISPALIDLFATRQFQYAGLYEFAIPTGGVIYYASGDVDILWDGNLYTCGGQGGVGPYFDRTDNKAKAHWKVGVEVDTLSFDVIPGTSLVQGEPFLSAVRQGVFDGAELAFSGAYWPQQTYQSPVVPTGTILKFVGRVAEVDCGRSLATFNVNSHLELLNQNMPRNLWQGSCVNTLFDTSCTLNQAAFAVSGTAQIGTTSNTINVNLGNSIGYFDLGTIIFMSGANEGFSRTIKTYVPGSISLIAPFPNVPAPGDAFNAYPGCNKTQAVCTRTFNNLQNFRGFPYVPENSTAV